MELCSSSVNVILKEFCMKINIGILAEAYYLPQTKKKVHEIFDDENVNFGTLSKNIDFRRDIGIEEVHVTDELPSEVALKAAQRVISPKPRRDFRSCCSF